MNIRLAIRLALPITLSVALVASACTGGDEEQQVTQGTEPTTTTDPQTRTTAPPRQPTAPDGEPPVTEGGTDGTSQTGTETTSPPESPPLTEPGGPGGPGGPSLIPAGRRPLLTAQQRAETQQQVRQMVSDAIRLYVEIGTQAFEAISDPAEGFLQGELYVSVYSTDGRTLANPADPLAVGENTFEYRSSDGTYPVRSFLESASATGGWSAVIYPNPLTGEEELRRSWSVFHDGYVFSAGYYLSPASLTQELVAEAVARYEEVGERAFGEFSDPDGSFVSGEFYVFGLDLDGVSVAHGADPSVVGTDRLGIRDSRGDMFIPRILAAASPEGGWVLYRRLNPLSGVEELKRSWVVRVDEWVLGVGYYLSPASLSQELVAEAVARYEEVGERAFGEFSDPDGSFVSGEFYVFGLDLDGVSVAHGADPSVVGTDRLGIRDSRGDMFIPRILAAASPEGGWVLYRRLNPLSGVEELKRSWVVRVDEWVLGVGYYLSPASLSQELVAEAVARYEEVGEYVFEEISDEQGRFKLEDFYVQVLSTDGENLADSAAATGVGLNLFNRQDSDDVYPYRRVLESASSTGGWSIAKLANPQSGEEMPRRTWALLHDGFVFSSGFFIDEEQWVQYWVSDAVELRAQEEEAAFTEISKPDGSFISGEIYVFALDADGRSLAHAANPSLVGTDRSDATDSRGVRFVELILDAATPDGSWVIYRRLNPVSGAEELKRSWVLRDGEVVFGAGYYPKSLEQDDLVRAQVADAVALYEQKGDAAFTEISDPRGNFIEGDIYVYVLSADGVSLAHAANPSLVGTDRSDATDSRGELFIQEILAAASEEGAWVSYRRLNPLTEVEELKRAWVVSVDDLVFGSGYYPTLEDFVRQQVADAVDLYEEKGDAAFAEISESGAFIEGEIYVFALDADGVSLAHAANPSLVGTDRSPATDSRGERFIPRILAAATPAGAWIVYRRLNPVSGSEELKRAWVVKSGDAVLGSGYYLSEEDFVKKMVADSIAFYDSAGDDGDSDQAFTAISNPSGRFISGDFYAFVLETDGVVLAHPGNPSLVGQNLFDLTDSDGVFVIRGILESASAAGGWSEYRFANPVSGLEEPKRTWAVIHDGYVFGSGYYTSEAAQVRQLATDAAALYAQVGERALEQFSDPEGSFVEDELYVFGLSAEGVSLAHGANPALVGTDRSAARDSRGELFIPKIVAAAAPEGAWVVYRRLNPETGEEELKRSWVISVPRAVASGGDAGAAGGSAAADSERIVLGAGYYLTQDELAQIYAVDAVARYEEVGERAWEEISDPQGDFGDGGIYVSVITPLGEVLASAIEELAGESVIGLVDSDGTNVLAEIMSKVSASGAWVHYRSQNPVTGVEEAKRSWVVFHDGLVFETGYYISEERRAQIQVSDAIARYGEVGDQVFGEISNPRGEYIRGSIYSFILSTAGVVLAHAASPSLVGRNLFDLRDSSGSFVIRSVLESASDSGGWSLSRFVNPADGLEQPKRTWAVLHDGYVFASGHYLSEADLVQKMVTDALALYDAADPPSPEAVFEQISDSAGDFRDGALYVFALSEAGRYLANASNPALVGVNRSRAADSRGEYYVPKLLAAATPEGAWVYYRSVNPVTRTEELKRSWVVEREGFVMGAGYYLSEPEYTRQLVADAVALYRQDGASAFAEISDPNGAFRDGSSYVYVLRNDGVALAHAANPSLVGRDLSDLQDSDGSYIVRGILNAATPQGAWAIYRFVNPETGAEEPKRSWVVRVDDFVFGSGHYINEARWVRYMVEAAVARYEQVGTRVLTEISAGGAYRAGSLYVFVYDTEGKVRANAADSSQVGRDLYGVQDSAGNFITRLVEQAASAVGGWTEFLEVNPVTKVEEVKRSYVVRYDDLMFGAGYFLSDIDLTKKLVNESLELYKSIGERAFATISDPQGDFISGSVYVFALDADGVSLAHAANPSLVGTDRSEARDSRGELFIPKILERASPEGRWVVYRRLNPVSGEEELKRSWVVRDGDVVLGAGYYLTPEELARHMVADAIALYRQDGESAFAAISASQSGFADGDSYLYVLSSRGVVRAHAANPSLVGRNRLALVDGDGRYSVLGILNSALASGGWSVYRSDNPVSGREGPKRTLAVSLDGYVFVSGYYISEADWAQMMVADAVALYKEAGSESALAEISEEDGSFAQGEIYAFVLEPEGKVRAQPVDERLFTDDLAGVTDSDGVRILEEITDAASAEGGWAQFKFTNPVSQQEELKNAWVVLHDGLVFGSGYYQSEADLAQERVTRAIELYKSRGERAFRELGDPDGDYVDGEYYVFVLDTDGVSFANVANPSLVGTDTSDLQDASGVFITREILARATPAGGWAEYRFVSPVNNREQRKRSWVVLYDGFVFGSGYYPRP